MALDIKKVREDFFLTSSRNKNITPVYFDNACTTLRPDSVIEAGNQYYYQHPACHSRAVHKLGKLTTTEFDSARTKVKNFLNAKKCEEIIFTKNTTEGLNIISRGLSFAKGDVILTTNMEHNSNLLPWQMLVNEKGVIHKRCEISPEDECFDLEKYKELFKENKIKVVSVFHASNVTGMILPIKKMAQIAHDNGALFILDAAQSIMTQVIDVQELDVDFLVFSFHKALGPSAFGVLYGKYDMLKYLRPYCYGGETVTDATYDSLTLAEIPNRFEAGLQNYAGAMAAGAAIDYLQKIGVKNICNHDVEINKLISNKFLENKNIKILGPQSAELRPSIINFQIRNRDMGEICLVLDETKNIMTRSGFHCCHAWYNFNKLNPSMRASFSMYNTLEEAHLFVETIEKIIRYF